MNPVQQYLSLQDPNALVLNLQWSPAEPTLQAGSCHVAFTNEIADFLEGFASQRPLIHFSFLMYLLMLLRGVKGTGAEGAETDGLLSLNRYKSWKNLRHSGAFCAQLCLEIPEARGAPYLKEICQQLRRPHSLEDEPYADFSLVSGEYPPFTPAEFKARILRELEKFTEEEIHYWLKHGRGPVQKAGEALARELPVTLAGRLVSLLERPRLAPAQAFIPKLTGALSLPPRQLTYQDLPLGGFTDVTTRGKPEFILPSQFALDEWEFLRRYAENELLYFRREDPSTQTQQELIVLLDQGVRTWGDVRLVLNAALVALGKQAIQRHMTFCLATTGSPYPLDPVTASEDELGQIVEASDLAPHPGLALETLLEQPVEHLRDIVLLTHPRSLREEEVCTAARRLRQGMRLFAMTLDRHGQAELSELHHGASVPVRQFHVDLTGTPRESPPAPPTSPTTDSRPWLGDVETVGFPFKFGIYGQIPAKGFDFDLEERYLLTACRQGILHLWEVANGPTLIEILPRAQYQGKLVTQITEVLGVANGFVAIGRVDQNWAAIHYHLGKRRCKVHLVSMNPLTWDYATEHHCLLVVELNRVEGHSIDLTTGERYSTYVGGPASRARAAWEAWEKTGTSRRIPCQGTPQGAMTRRWFYLDSANGEVTIFTGKPPLETLCPLADGKPLLRNLTGLSAQIGGDCLALQVFQKMPRGADQLHVFRRNGVPLYQAELGGGYRLSSGGKWLARQLRNGLLQLVSLDEPVKLGPTFSGGFNKHLHFSMGKEELFIFPGKRMLIHHLKWSGGKLECRVQYLTGNTVRPDASAKAAMPDFLPDWLKNDSQRWVFGARDNLLVVSDRFSQVAIFDRHDQLVCMFKAFRQQLAGWMPDGTCFGPPVMTGRPATVDAKERIARALCHAQSR